MRLGFSKGIFCRNDHPFLWSEEFGRARRLDIPQAIDLLELWIFSFYDSGAELAPIANGAPAPEQRPWSSLLTFRHTLARLDLNWYSKIVVFLNAFSILRSQADCFQIAA
jgi:hypothetical protein